MYRERDPDLLLKQQQIKEAEMERDKKLFESCGGMKSFFLSVAGDSVVFVGVLK